MDFYFYKVFNLILQSAKIIKIIIFNIKSEKIDNKVFLFFWLLDVFNNIIENFVKQ